MPEPTVPPIRRSVANLRATGRLGAAAPSFISNRPTNPVRVKSLLQSPRPTDQTQTVRINAAAIADAIQGVLPNATLVLRVKSERLEVIYAGPTSMCPESIGPPHRTIDASDRLLMPGLINAHTHLDLSHIGPVSHEPGDGFVKWVDHIRANRHQEDEGIAEAVDQGIQLSIAGGTVAVGDIAGAPAGRLTSAPARALAKSALAGVSYLEFFGIGQTAVGITERLADFVREQLPGLRSELCDAQVRMGLQPHAPNTVDLGVYRWAAAIARTHRLPFSTHLAETPEERQFIEAGIGPQRKLLERLGVWENSILDHVGRGKHPVEHLLPVLCDQPVLCAHVNDATDQAIAMLSQTKTPVAYCPRASEYFGAADHFGPHRYREMLEAGVPVCLGTDSIVNLDTPDRISVLDEMRLLHQRDGTDAQTLLTMATTNGAAALELDPDCVTFQIGPILGVIGVPVLPDGSDPWTFAMTQKSAPEYPILSRERF